MDSGSSTLSADVLHLRENIPEELKELDQWVGWNWKRLGSKKWTKVPYDLKTGKPASSIDPETWASYEEAKSHENIGFMFSENDPYCGIDLDKCISEGGEVTRSAQKIVDRLASYAEVSPSGTGIKVWVKGNVPGERRKNPEKNIEMYDSRRFFTVTGRVFGSGGPAIMEANGSISKLYDWLFPEPEEKESVSAEGHRLLANHDLSDADILSHAYRARNGEKFVRLWGGDTEGYGSHSEADLALCSMIAFWTGPDPNRIAALFAESDLCRGKWLDRPTYRMTTIGKALSDMTEFYNPTTGGSYTLPKEAQGADEKTRLASLESAPIFPVDALPESCRRIVTEGAASIGCPVDYVALPVLSVLSQGVGASRVVQVKRGWRESATLFVAVVGDPGAKKSPPARLATRPVWNRDGALEREFYRQLEEYEGRMAAHESTVKDAKGRGESAPTEPEEPKMERCVTVDVTVEALIEILADNPRGLLVDRDELTGWIRAMDQYKGGKGSDKQHWLSFWSNAPVKFDRKNQKGRPVSAHFPMVTLSGNIQPRMLKELGETSEEGMIERFLFAYPENRRQRFSYDEVSYEAEREYEDLYTKLTRYEMTEDSLTGRREPNVVQMAPEAREMFALCSDRIASEMEEPGFPHRLRGAFSKLEGYLARLALILALCRCVETGEVEQVEREDVDAAHHLVRYFAGHARRIHGEMGGATPEEMLEGALNHLIREGNGSWQGTAGMLHEDLEAIGFSPLPDSTEAVGKIVRTTITRSSSLTFRNTNVKNREGERRKGFSIEMVTQPTQPTQPTQKEGSGE